MAKKQTAVEWFWNEIAETLPFTVDSQTAIRMYDKLHQAKQMEKEQIMNAHIEGLPFEMEATKQAEQYYTETYNKQS